ncbi:DNA glycosylase [Lineolata rhizophorae]|uniref:Endonuclease III homolog n=1 Tax=Lineolata rhizophorae TaxID=578093 RepID=A0A6A6NMP6_9PEZI|nr:DNA glycosylase [Lineolata rhizophorae]
MRTSRISRETEKAVSSMPTRSRPARQSPARARFLRSYALDGRPSTTPESTADNASEDSGLSDPPSDLGRSDAEPSAQPSQQSRKRKRGLSTPEIPKSLGAKSTSSSSATMAKQASSPAADGAAARTRAPRRKPARKAVGPAGSVAVAPPTGWETLYNATLAMRSRIAAPVDTMGCERLADEAAPARDRRFHTLVSLMLSSQTKDAVTAAAMRRLQTELPGGLRVGAVLAADAAALDEMIGKVGFHNTKARNVKRVAAILRERYADDIPDSVEGLVALPGVGPKMAFLCMSAAWGRDEGIGVDVHVHRITNLWGWHKTNTPEETRAALESWLPRDKWREINWLLVGLGQTVCTPVRRKCGECDLGLKGLCPARVMKEVNKAKKEIKVEVEGSAASPRSGGKTKVVERVKKGTEIEDPANEEAVAGSAIKHEFSPSLPDIEDSGLGPSRLRGRRK